MKIRPAHQYRRFLPASLTMLGSIVIPGCDQKLGGDVPATPEMQKKWQAESHRVQPPEAPVPTDDDSQQLGGEPAEQ